MTTSDVHRSTATTSTARPFGTGRALRPSTKVLPEHARGHNRSLVLQTLYRAGTQSRAEGEAALRPAMGEYARWYLDQIETGVGQPQEASQLVAELTGTPAESVAQWAARNANLFR